LRDNRVNEKAVLYTTAQAVTALNTAKQKMKKIQKNRPTAKK